ncbi:MAG TPA: nucleotidyltransferase [Gaiellaceae bacterium]|nr:nucleotidyltransferase [Gaiellaceae bacterium]
MTERESFEELLTAMKTAAGALNAAEVPFLLGGGLACWARGGPRTEHDVDFFVRPQDAEAALAALARAGMRTERPPEQWLFKAWDSEILVDVIFEPSGRVVDEALFARADEMDVYAVRMHVASLEDVLASKLLSLNEQNLDFGPPLEIARALREQIHWPTVRELTRHSACARAFLVLVEGLGIVAADGGAANGSADVGLRQDPHQPSRLGHR